MSRFRFLMTRTRTSFTEKLQLPPPFCPRGRNSVVVMNNGAHSVFMNVTKQLIADSNPQLFINVTEQFL